MLTAEDILMSLDVAEERKKSAAQRLADFVNRIADERDEARRELSAAKYVLRLHRIGGKEEGAWE